MRTSRELKKGKERERADELPLGKPAVTPMYRVVLPTVTVRQKRESIVVVLWFTRVLGESVYKIDSVNIFQTSSVPAKHY